MTRRSRTVVLLALTSAVALAASAVPAMAQGSDADVVLLEPSDLPPGYVVEPSTGTSDVPCGGPDLLDVTQARGTAARSFGATKREPVLYQQVLVYARTAEAVDVQQDIRAAAGSCARYEVVEEDDPADTPPMIVRSEVVTPPPGLASPAVAVHTSELEWDVHRLYVRSGPVLVVLAAGSDRGSDEAATLIAEVAPRIDPLLETYRADAPDDEADPTTAKTLGALAGAGLLAIVVVAAWRDRRSRRARAR